MPKRRPRTVISRAVVVCHRPLSFLFYFRLNLLSLHKTLPFRGPPLSPLPPRTLLNSSPKSASSFVNSLVIRCRCHLFFFCSEFPSQALDTYDTDTHKASFSSAAAAVVVSGFYYYCTYIFFLSYSIIISMTCLCLTTKIYKY